MFNRCLAPEGYGTRGFRCITAKGLTCHKQCVRSVVSENRIGSEKGKPIERWGRKAVGLRFFMNYDGWAAAESFGFLGYPGSLFGFYQYINLLTGSKAWDNVTSALATDGGI
jgi:hypothetical protein